MKNYEELYNRELSKLELKISKLFKDKKPESLYTPSTYIMKSGGKRIRPMLVLFSAKAAGGNFYDVYNAAIAVELIHNFTLVHDDIMDNADKRRGRATLHKKYDLNTAILTGDNLIPIAFEFLLKDLSNNQLDIVNLFTKGIREVCEGQSMDEEFELRDSVSISEYKKMIEKKTAALLKMCCSVGAKIVTKEKKIINSLENFGKNLGMAFQLNDDLLDLMADEKRFGKVIGGDLIEGKKTFLLLTALQLAEGKDKNLLRKALTNRVINEKDVLEFKELFLKLGVIKKTQREIKKYSIKATSQLEEIPGNKYVDVLQWLTEKLTKREN